MLRISRSEASWRKPNMLIAGLALTVFVLSSCDPENATDLAANTPAAPGTLRFAINGVRDGSAGVSATGPDGYSATVHRLSTELTDLKPGDYTITMAGVFTGGYWYYVRQHTIEPPEMNGGTVQLGHFHIEPRIVIAKVESDRVTRVAIRYQ